MKYPKTMMKAFHGIKITSTITLIRAAAVIMIAAMAVLLVPGQVYAQTQTPVAPGNLNQKYDTPDYTLSTLTFDSGTLTPDFNSNIQNYTLTVPSGVTSIGITATLSDTSNSLLINGENAVSGTMYQLDLTSFSPGDNYIGIDVIPPGTSDSAFEYIIDFVMPPNFTLSTLTFDSGTLTPDFSSNIQNYTLTVPIGVASIGITATLSDPTNSLCINGDTNAVSGQLYQLDVSGFSTGDNYIGIDVMLPGTSDSAFEYIIDFVMPPNFTLSSLTFDSGTLDQTFNSNIQNYTLTVPSGVTSIGITATLSDPTNSLLIAGDPNAVSGQLYQLDVSGFSPGDNYIGIDVIPPGSSDSAFEYIIDFYMPTLSSDATLSGLVISSGTLSPSFSSSCNDYTASVNKNTDKINVTPTVNDSNATVTVNNNTVASGTPQTINLATGDNPITIVVTAQDGTTLTYNIVVTRGTTPSNTITIRPATLRPATAGMAYLVTFKASGGKGPYTFSESGNLPSGLTFSNTGIMSGRTYVTGSFAVTVTATDANGLTGTRKYTLTVNAPNITVTPCKLCSAIASKPYKQIFKAYGGSGPYTYNESGALPSGMTFTNTGVLSGKPSVKGSFTFTITATDANGFTGSRKYTLTVNVPCIKIEPDCLQPATAGISYSWTFKANGGTGPYTFNESGDLPTGLTFSQNGILSGKPSLTGSFNITITATDANGFNGSQKYTLTVKALKTPCIKIETSKLRSADVGEFYKQTFCVSGGKGPYTFSESGTLPAGLSLSTTGVLSGKPSVKGSFNFTVTVTDANGNTSSRDYTLVVLP